MRAVHCGDGRNHHATVTGELYVNGAKGFSLRNRYQTFTRQLQNREEGHNNQWDGRRFLEQLREFYMQTRFSVRSK